MSKLLLKLPWFVAAPLIVVVAAGFAYVGYAFTGDYFNETCKNERNLLTGEFEASNCGEGAKVAARLKETEAVIAVGGGQVGAVQPAVPSPGATAPMASASPTGAPGVQATADSATGAPTPSAVTSASAESTTMAPAASPSTSPTATPAAAQPTATPTSPPPAPTAKTGVIAAGAFRNGAPGHNGSGSVQAQQLADGKVNLFLSNLSVTNGPDLYVVLSASPTGDYSGGDLLVAKLKANNGSQNYALPAGVDLSRYNSVSIWCKSFDVTFAYAPLEPR